MTDSNIQVPDALSIQRLQAMELVAKMRAAADRVGSGFIGGFIDPNTGEQFTMTNMDPSTIPNITKLLED
jgi:hypothetical protein